MTTTTANLATPTATVATATRRDLWAIVGLFALLSAAYWAAIAVFIGQAGFPLDDSYIHLQFARNFYETGVLAFNKGVPSTGSTAPLFPVLIALAYAVVHDWYLASWIVGGLCSLGTALVVYTILRSWTGRQDLARWGGLLTVVASPTIVQAYCGMESGPYALLFLIGLWLYGASRPKRLAASAVFAACIWLRPEFLVMLPIISVERLIAGRRAGLRGLSAITAFAREIFPHALLWAGMVAVYGAYHWHIDHQLVPNTFRAKAVAPWILRPAWLEGLPGALKRGNPLFIFLAIFVWPALVLMTTGIGLGVNCVPVSFGMRECLLANWRENGATASARRLALLTLIGYPWLRGFVDTGGFVLFQFQRYYAHLTPLFILLVIASWPMTGAIVQRRWWNWRGVPLHIQQRRTLGWALLGTLIIGVLGVMSVGNINTMQVALGQWVKANTRPDQLIATNDIGAVGFIGERPILDTVGLVEPAIVQHYLAGKEVLSYLQTRDPAYVILFPRWYPEVCSRTDLLKPVESITLTHNVVCGGSTMTVYRPLWPNHRAD